MSRKKPRGLRPDEQKLWAQVARSATPLNEEVKSKFEKADVPGPPKTPEPKKRTPVAPFEVGARAKPGGAGHSLRPDLSDETKQALNDILTNGSGAWGGSESDLRQMISHLLGSPEFMQQ